MNSVYSYFPKKPCSKISPHLLVSLQDNNQNTIKFINFSYAFQDTTNERVHFNLGMLAMDDRDIAGAEHWFRHAVQLKEDFRSALFNLALLLTDDHRPLEAAPFLNQLVKFYPDHVKGLILLGDIYINTIKDLDAAENVSLMGDVCNLFNS